MTRKIDAAALGRRLVALATEAGYPNAAKRWALHDGNVTPTDLAIAKFYADAFTTTEPAKRAALELVSAIDARLGEMSTLARLWERTFDDVGNGFLTRSPAGSSLDAPVGTELRRKQRQ